MSGRRIRPSSHRIRRENELIRQRDKEFRYEQLWNGQNEYYKHWEKSNTKFEEWTSPRYYESNNHLLEEIKQKKDKEENLNKRREKLKRLLEQEDEAYQVEFVAKKLKDKLNICHKKDDPINIVSGVINLNEDDRKRHEAELNLYHKWRRKKLDFNKPTEVKDVKLSWLDQQIETRMKNEKEKEEKKKRQKNKKEQLEQQLQESKKSLEVIEEKKHELQKQLDDYVNLLSKKENVGIELKQEENQQLRLKEELEGIIDEWKNEKQRRTNTDLALNKFRSFKVKLQKKSLNIVESLHKEEFMINHLKKLISNKIFANSQRQSEIEQVLNEFFLIINQQKELEKKRLNKFAFVFNSEERYLFQQQNVLWDQEENSRKTLIDDVLDSLKSELNDQSNKIKDKEIEILRDREELIGKIEEFCQKIRELEENERDLNRDIERISREI